MRAAVRAGADAVYLGLRGFNARARAANFDAGELEARMQELHASGVRGYVTLNTLVFDEELAGLEAAVRACAKAGVDAVIVQDLGVARLVKAVAPELPIHASTQMTCTDAAGVELAREMGATRVILARELSVEDITAIRQATDAELEVFVHGALCISYSGQCLTSEAIGGRSANRGACAQACRLPYELVVDGELQDLGERAYLLSPEDLEASALVPELARLGVSALKIEGRLKGPAYVAATTALYRAAVDGAVPPEGRRAALQTYTRGSGPGFLAGVDHQRLVEGRSCDHRGERVGTCAGVRRVRGRDEDSRSPASPEPGRNMLRVVLDADVARGDGLLVEGGWAGEGEVGGRVWALHVAAREVERARAGEEALVWLGPEKAVAVGGALAGRRVFRTDDPANERQVLQKVAREGYRVAIDARLSGRLGEPFVLEATSARGHRARVVGEAPVVASRTAPVTEEVVREKLSRLGDTPFRLAKIRIDLPEGAMVPMSALNRARRALADALVTSARREHATTGVSHEAVLSSAVPPDRAPPPAGLFALCRTTEQAHAAVDAGADGVVLDFLELTGTGAAVRSLRARSGSTHITLAPPRIRKPGEEKIDAYLRDLRPDALLVRSLGGLRECRHSPASPMQIGDFALNVTNRLTAAAVLACGLAAFTPSFDLDAAQLATLCASPFGPYAEVVVYHPMPLFHMEHCVIAALLSDGRDHKTCGRPCEKHHVSLRDRAGMDHPVMADIGCRNTVFHAAAQSAAGLMLELQRSGVRRFRVELVRESAAEVGRILEGHKALLAGRTTPAELQRRLRAEARYGVVSGSLRVLG
jgi:putative protease